MKKTILLAAMLTLAVMMMVAPAMAADRDDRLERLADRFFDDFFDLDDRFFFDRFDHLDRFGFDGGEVNQDVEQEAESGDVEQSFEVSGGGDNFNQCAGIQGVANTGNAQNQIGVTQIGSDADDFEFEDVGSSIEVSPENSTTCDQQVNQAASAFGS